MAKAVVPTLSSFHRLLRYYACVRGRPLSPLITLNHEPIEWTPTIPMHSQTRFEPGPGSRDSQAGVLTTTPHLLLCCCWLPALLSMVWYSCLSIYSNGVQYICWPGRIDLWSEGGNICCLWIEAWLISKKTLLSCVCLTLLPPSFLSSFVGTAGSYVIWLNYKYIWHQATYVCIYRVAQK